MFRNCRRRCWTSCCLIVPFDMFCKGSIHTKLVVVQSLLANGVCRHGGHDARAASVVVLTYRLGHLVPLDVLALLTSNRVAVLLQVSFL